MYSENRATRFPGFAGQNAQVLRGVFRVPHGLPTRPEDHAVRCGTRLDGKADMTLPVALSAECLRLGLADEVRYSILPVVIGEGISFFEGLDRTVALHLLEVKAYRSGMVALRHEVRKAK